MAGGREVGTWLTLEETWRLSRAWYHDRLDEEFHGRTLAEAVAIFEQLGMTGPFWSLA
ncbi:MAG TPA: hypothetical protein VD789_02725 [Thermomicrobiales bacterium]|nr:hypothetical protein [Thermomicrobiales bacterium]